MIVFITIENMSRIGLKPITIPEGVTVSVEKRMVHVKGPKGQLSVPFSRKVAVEYKDSVLTVSRSSEVGAVRATHGLIRSLIANAVYGVTSGFEKKLEIQGVGYRAAVQGNKLVLTVGYSHPVDFPKPEDISFQVKGPIITVSGFDKQRVGEVSAQIRRVRVPDSYKGKGIRYQGEYVKLKPGKAAKAAAA